MTALLEVDGLVKHFVAARSVFGRPTAHVKAVDGVSFTVEAGKTLALVGESGCGKSTVSRLVLRLIEPDAGTVRFEGRNLGALNANELRGFRRDAQIIFQDPYASLNPRMLNAAQRFLTNAPWMAIWPGLAIFLVVLSFNLVGDGLRDALDPRERA